MVSYPSVPSKLLLFGEYSILMGSSAITLPLWNFDALLQISGTPLSSEASKSNQNLRNFYNYLIKNKSSYEDFIHLNGFWESLENGLYLRSNIPEGCGLGSSGSVCVSIYRAFASKVIDDLQFLKVFFGHMESFFHGKSSGIDPMAIYMEKPLLFKGPDMEVLEPKKFHLPDNMHIYLLDSRIARKSETFIESFLEHIKDPTFQNIFNQNYIPILEEIIESLISKTPFRWELLNKLSALQLQYFQKMIPTPILKIWKESLSTNNFCIKLLGAGGGGYFLVFSLSALNSLGGYSLIKI
jgi:mevalonate kinase